MYVCECAPNFEGPQCMQAVDPCIGNSCKNGATCIPNTLTTGYTCSCVPGTTGTYCEMSINVCLSNPCGSYGVCIQPAINVYQWLKFILYFRYLILNLI